ncbi:MAG: virulence RhuM family protein [Spirochaetales bacterium]|nr:virulence RhuM family protein [Spirochaetales bacterium]
MGNEINRYEVVKFTDGGFELEVSVSPQEETVWLTQEQISLLFDVDLSRVSRHINKIYSEEELASDSTLAENAIVQKEGSRFISRKVKMYNLDMIIAVGYRVNSKRGTLFRRWANSVLKQYMLKGYSIDPARVLVTQENYLDLVKVVNRIDSRQENLASRLEKLEEKNSESGHRLFFKGQLYDAVSCIGRIISEAKESIVLIDNYVDGQTLDLMTKKGKSVTVTFITSNTGSRITPKELDSFHRQYGKLDILFSNEFHDRFLILDGRRLYHIGASLKDAGRKTFGLSEIDDSKYLENLLTRILDFSTDERNVH